MSCQQVSRFITTTPSITNTNTVTTTITTTAATNVTLPATIAAGAEADAALDSTIPATAISASTVLSTTAGSIASLTAATAEDQDPYVFTESVHTTPPVHFNAQKSRIRHVDSTATPPTAASTTTTTLDKELTVVNTTSAATLPTITNAKNCNHNSNFKYTITSTLASTLHTTTTTTSANAAVTNCNDVSPVTTTCTSTTPATTSTSKHGKQQKQPQQQRKRQTICKSSLLPTSPPISPPLAGCVQQAHQLQNDTKVLSPTCNLQLTPSLWQTPLLLDTNINNIPPTSNNHNNHNNNNSKNNTITSTNLTLATTTQTTTTTTNTHTTTTTNNGNVSINSPMHSPTTVTTTLLANITTHSATTLPPSNFHHTTLAQHLHKVECIKKPPKRQTAMCIATQKMVMTPPATPPTPPTTLPILLPPLQPLQTAIEQIQKPIMSTTTTPTPTTTTTTTTIDTEFIKEEIGDDVDEEKHHSDTDLNDIPVNVIFRKPQPTTTTASLSATPTTPTTIKQEMPTIKVEQIEQPKLIQIIASPIKQQKQQQQQPPQQSLAKPTLIMPCTKVDIEAAVSTLQSMQQIALKEERSSNAQQQKQQQQQQQQQHYINLQKQVIINKNILNKTPAIKEKTVAQPKDLTCNKKLRGKPIPASPSIIQNSSLAVDHGTAVAIVKMSLSELSAETTQLSKASVLPYCLQQHWLRTESSQKRTSREERIAQSKNLLRRQALQLLNTQGLQKLPLNAARKRLTCVDRLLRKYNDGKLHTEHLK